MDVLNTLDNIIPKMRQQMFQKRIYSLDVLYELIEEEGKYYSIKELDILLGKIGIYLKSQEVTLLLLLLFSLFSSSLFLSFLFIFNK